MSNRETCEVPFAVVSSKSACCASQTEICNSYFFWPELWNECPKGTLLEQEVLARCYWFSSEYNPSFSLEPDCLSERTLPLVLVVKNVETISPWTDSSRFEKLPRQIPQPAKLASWQTVSPKLEPCQASTVHSKPLSQHPTPCHSLSSAKKASHAMEIIVSQTFSLSWKLKRRL